MRTGKRYIKVENRRKDLFKIKQVAEILNTTPRTIRYYEQIDLLPKVKRTQGKMRLYTNSDMELIKEIKRLQNEGLSLDEIKIELYKFQQNLLLNQENNKIKILVDSTASIPFDLARQNGIEIIPLHIKLGKEDLLDGLDINAEQLKQRVEEGRLQPESSPPTEEEFIEMYHRLYEAGAEKIISIHLSEKISNSVKIARKAAAFIKDFEVQVVDSGSMAAGTALLAFTAAANIANKIKFTEILYEIEELKKKKNEAIVLNSVEKIMGQEKDNNLLKMFLSFKPVLTMKEGNLSLRSRAKNMEEAEAQLISFCKEQKDLSHIIVLNSNMLKYAEHLLVKLEKVFREAKIIILPYSSVLAANLANELLGVAVC
ncbi:MAG: DegV family EDD domain-containing protein [Candidatus Margulisbacteria bacterium]|nr:DegV family EDD domain-containing protein [Candidatus Margulisiibacteriota bacterium]